MWCLLIHNEFINLIFSGKKTWEVRTQKLFKEGERIALGNTKTKLVEGYADISEVKKLTVQEMKRHNDQHFGNDFISERWSDRDWLYAFVLANAKRSYGYERYPRSNGSPKVRLKYPLLES
jgi:hypothetical protein